MMIDQDTRLIDVTLSELADYLLSCGFVCRGAEKREEPRAQQARAPRPELVGIKGLAEYLKLSVNTAGKYYRAGVFDKAVVKVGARNLRFDKELALEAARKTRRHAER